MTRQPPRAPSRHFTDAEPNCRRRWREQHYMTHINGLDVSLQTITVLVEFCHDY
jgi:hypothetical protein